ncbi:MAG: helix-turn-helix transcriptional regulator, partial [Anaerolineae bacterium]|nr:helix-turn-helix transcriptional regulator [Anaerolineae bacterium]
RTEGWIAGLQLAAISMQGQDDKKQFIDAFTGSHSYIMDYLLEEVLSQQGVDVRQFLLQTSILDRLNADLCDAVTEQSGSQAILEQLERRNLFVVSLDQSREWFRYHHLFADVLQARLKREAPEIFTSIHQRASRWYEEHASMPDAIRHAFLAQDDPLAARLLELVWSEMDLSYQSAKWFKWAKQLPEDVLLAQPVMCLGYAWALVNQGDFQAGERYLQMAENFVEHDPKDLVVHDVQQWEMLPAAIISARAYIAMATGQIDQTIHYAKESLRLSTDPTQTSHRQASALLGFASWARGDLLSADTALENYLLSMNYLGSAIIAYIADLRIQLGRVQDAYRIYQDGLQRIDDFPSLGTEELYRGLAEFHLELGNLDEARKYLDRSKSLGEHLAILTWRQRYCVTEAQYYALLGDYETALEQLNIAETHYLQTAMPDIRPISAQKARIWIKQGRLDEVERWSQQQDATPEKLHYLKEYEHITLARYALAQFRLTNHSDSYNQANALLVQLRSEAERGSRLRSAIEIQLLQAELAAVS